MPTVYVVQEPMKRFGSGEVKPRVDLTPATRYGRLVYLLDWSDTKTIDAARLLQKLREGLYNFNDDDYIMMIGDPVAMAMAGMVALDLNEGRARILTWDNRKRDYICTDVDMDAQPPMARNC